MSLYYYGARYYNPRVSQWLSVDPIALYDPINEVEHYLDVQHNGGYFNPRNTSVYGYTYQNPIVYVDPNGKQSEFSETMKAVGKGLHSTAEQLAPFRPLNEQELAEHRAKYGVSNGPIDDIIILGTIKRFA